MNHQSLIKDYIADALRTNCLAVPATEGDGQPHACLISITPKDDFVDLIFATYRSTRKYNNLINNGKLAILFENRSTKSLNQSDITVLTAFGYAKEVDIAIITLRTNPYCSYMLVDNLFLTSLCRTSQ